MIGWDFAIEAFVGKYGMAQGLRSSTLANYKRLLEQFQSWLDLFPEGARSPGEVTSQDLYRYIEHLRRQRLASDATVNTHVATLRAFYRAIVAMQYLEPKQNPTTLLPRLKAPKQRVPDILTPEEAERLLQGPCRETVLGLRDRAILALLYGTGVRASECAHLKEGDVHLELKQIRVLGKGGHQRVLPLEPLVCQALQSYRRARGEVSVNQPFFRTRSRRGTSRGVIYERVKRFTRKAGIHKRVTPHVIRHTFATVMLRVEKNIRVIQELLGHRWITSTQRYVHLSGEDLRNAISKHPVGDLAKSLSDVFISGKIRLQWPPGTRFAINTD